MRGKRGAHRRHLALGLLAVAVASGCGRGDVGAVSGRVLGPGGGPLAKARVTATSTGGGKTVYGTTDADGNFSLSTGNPTEGVPPGDYRVGVVEDLGDPELHRKPSIDRKYGNAATSGITVSVAAGDEKTLNIELGTP